MPSFYSSMVLTLFCKDTFDMWLDWFLGFYYCFSFSRRVATNTKYHNIYVSGFLSLITQFLCLQWEQISSSSRNWELRNGVSMTATLHLRGLQLRFETTWYLASVLNLRIWVDQNRLERREIISPSMMFACFANNHETTLLIYVFLWQESNSNLDYIASIAEELQV